jgi:hypothetical protein
MSVRTALKKIFLIQRFTYRLQYNLSKWQLQRECKASMKQFTNFQSRFWRHPVCQVCVVKVKVDNYTESLAWCVVEVISQVKLECFCLCGKKKMMDIHSMGLKRLVYIFIYCRRHEWMTNVPCNENQKFKVAYLMLLFFLMCYQLSSVYLLMLMTFKFKKDFLPQFKIY